MQGGKELKAVARFLTPEITLLASDVPVMGLAPRTCGASDTAAGKRAPMA